MFLRPLSVVALAVLALGAAVFFGSGCDQLDEIVKEIEAQHGGGGGQPGGGTGGGPQWEDACNNDGECRIQADYCTGCDCRAIDPGTPPAVCDGPGVQCLVDPCAGKTAKCVNHACLVADAPTR